MIKDLILFHQTSFVFMLLTGLIFYCEIALFVIRPPLMYTQQGKNLLWTGLGMYMMCFLSIWISLILGH